jgi:hypothetical protein
MAVKVGRSVYIVPASPSRRRVGDAVRCSSLGLYSLVHQHPAPMSPCVNMETGNQHLVLECAQGSPDVAAVYRRWHPGLEGAEGQCGDVLSSNFPITNYYCSLSVFSAVLQKYLGGTFGTILCILNLAKSRELDSKNGDLPLILA